MSTLNEYLVQKRQALLKRQEEQNALAAKSWLAPHVIKAKASAEGRSGVRRIRIRDFQVISDSGPDFAGYDLGPSSPELQLGVLGSCLTHVYLIQAAARQVPLDSLEVEIEGELQPLAGKPGYEGIPIYPHNISYTVHVTSSASEAEIGELHQAVEKACPILNLLINPQYITSKIIYTPAETVGQEVSI